MRVRCVKIINPATLEVDASSAWVRVGDEYVVLEMMSSTGRKFSLRILHADNSTGIWESEMFVGTDPSIPSNWVARISEGGGLRMGPQRWLEPGFWDQYFDDEPAAAEAYEQELAIILAESNRTG